MSKAASPTETETTLPKAVAKLPLARQRVTQPPLSKALKFLLATILLLFALLAANSVYLVAIRTMELTSGQTYQNFFYLEMFLLHLIFGLAIIPPLIVFLIGHIRRVYRHRNRRAVRAGYGLLAASLILIVSGVVLMRIEGIIDVNHPLFRTAVFWAHVISPIFVIWLYLLHRLAGRRIRWRLGAGWLIATSLFIALMIGWHQHDPRKWNVAGPKSGEAYFFPSLARTSTGNFIPAAVLNNDQYCAECHTEAHRGWMHSAHRMSSFNNPAYLFSVKNTRKEMMKRHGDVKASRFCAGCHDPVPFLSGAFDDPKFDDPNYDLEKDVFAQAGITCTTCHAISHINDVRGNGSYTIDEPINYPFTDNENPSLRWISRQLVKAKPQFHKSSMLKPLHKTTEFCGACHKVHLPTELNDYKWLRGQNHYDSFWLSGVSGHNVESFYYPPKAEENCNACHMPLREVDHAPGNPNFAARVRDDSGKLKTLDHQFPSANTALPFLLRDQLPNFGAAIQRHVEFNKGIVRVDLFGIREGGRIDGKLQAPLDIARPQLEPGKTYLLDAVVRTLKIGHFLTQGTADSNELWLDITLRLNGDIIGRSGGMDSRDRSVDPWSHFLNAFVIDREGNRINRRNAEDISVALYDNQIPPGAAATVHYRFTVPADAAGKLEIEAKLKYRKFDTEYMQLVHIGNGKSTAGDYVNDLPIMTLAVDQIELPLTTAATPQEKQPVKSVPEWQRWNDFGIGLLLRGKLRQAKEAFEKVESLGMPDGPLNLARVHLREGAVTDEAPAALRRARELVGPKGETAPAWTVLWLSGLVNKQNAKLDEALINFVQIAAGGFAQAHGRRFDFEKDYRLLNEIADTYFLMSPRHEARQEFLLKAERYYQKTLSYDPENVTAHYGLHRVYQAMGENEKSVLHAAAHQLYKVDDNVRDIAVAKARRRYPAADVAAEQVVIYDLQRAGAFELPPTTIAKQPD